MTLLDDKLAKQTLFERIVDPLMNSRRWVIVAATTFAISVLISPVVAYFLFAYFTAKEGPWWLDPMVSVWSLSLFLSGSALLLLGLAKLMESRRD
jgi:hypothetical protein